MVDNIAVHQSRLDEARKHQDKQAEGEALTHLGFYRAQRGEIAYGIRTLLEAESIFLALGDRYFLAFVYDKLSDIYGFQLRDPRQGVQYLKKAVALSPAGSSELEERSGQLERIKARYPELF